MCSAGARPNRTVANTADATANSATLPVDGEMIRRRGCLPGGSPRTIGFSLPRVREERGGRARRCDQQAFRRELPKEAHACRAEREPDP
jgi:hypothetical protein